MAENRSGAALKKANETPKDPHADLRDRTKKLLSRSSLDLLAKAARMRPAIIQAIAEGRHTPDEGDVHHLEEALKLFE